MLERGHSGNCRAVAEEDIAEAVGRLVELVTAQSRGRTLSQRVAERGLSLPE